MIGSENNIASDAPDDRTFRGSRLAFVVLSRSRIRHTIIDEPHVVISIGDPGDPDAEIAASPGNRAILRLRFDDIDPERPACVAVCR